MMHKQPCHDLDLYTYSFVRCWEKCFSESIVRRRHVGALQKDINIAAVK